MSVHFKKRIRSAEWDKWIKSVQQNKDEYGKHFFFTNYIERQSSFFFTNYFEIQKNILEFLFFFFISESSYCPYTLKITTKEMMKGHHYLINKMDYIVTQFHGKTVIFWWKWWFAVIFRTRRIFGEGSETVRRSRWIQMLQNVHWNKRF